MKTAKEIFDLYPLFFTTNAWGEPIEDYNTEEPYIGVGKGWYDIIYDIMLVIVSEKDRLVKEGSEDKPLFWRTQIKEKFGGLRFYISSGTDKIYDAITKGEDESYKICESCGSRENVTTEGSWLKTLCKKCKKI